MDATTVSLLVGVCGIAATTAIGVGGLYLNAKARSNAMRDTLFRRQLENIAVLVRAQARFRALATVAAKRNDIDRDMIVGDMAEVIDEFAGAMYEGAALMPSDMWSDVNELRDYMVSTVVAYEQGESIDEGQLATMVALMIKIVLLSRALAGVDQLTEGSLNILSSNQDYKNVAEMETASFQGMCDEIHAQSKGAARDRADTQSSIEDTDADSK